METESLLNIPAQESMDETHDQVLVITRVLAAIIVPILLAAFIILYLFPNDTGRLFAWPVKPTMSAMLLGATYLGGAYFFTRVTFSRQWHMVRIGFLPVSTFAGILGIATILHWDKFSHGHIAFILWALLYFVLPFVILVVWYFNQRVNRQKIQKEEGILSYKVRIAIGLVGSIMTAASAVLLIFPESMMLAWPWTLSPLTARVMSAMFALPGLVGLGIAADGRWSSASIIFQAQGVSILFFLAAVVRARDEIQWGGWGIWAFLGGLLMVLILIGWASLQRIPRRVKSQVTT
jgi:hypothetical protein